MRLRTLLLIALPACAQRLLVEPPVVMKAPSLREGDPARPPLDAMVISEGRTLAAEIEACEKLTVVAEESSVAEVSQGDERLEVQLGESLRAVQFSRPGKVTVRSEKGGAAAIRMRGSCEGGATLKSGGDHDLTHLRWAGGKMQAAPLFPGADSYIGLLSGTIGVPEHVHDVSWEVVITFAAKGDFSLSGKRVPLGPYSVVAIPPNTRHAWSPDPGSHLFAVQIYTPPGPEERFKLLDAKERERPRSVPDR